MVSFCASDNTSLKFSLPNGTIILMLLLIVPLFVLLEFIVLLLFDLDSFIISSLNFSSSCF